MIDGLVIDYGVQDIGLNKELVIKFAVKKFIDFESLANYKFDDYKIANLYGIKDLKFQTFENRWMHASSIDAKSYRYVINTYFILGNVLALKNRIFNDLAQYLDKVKKQDLRLVYDRIYYACYKLYNYGIIPSKENNIRLKIYDTY